jgi:hypothetical protein
MAEKGKEGNKKPGKWITLLSHRPTTRLPNVGWTNGSVRVTAFASMSRPCVFSDPTVVLHHADVCKWRPRRTYRFISAWDSIWHVGLEQQRPLMLKLMHALEIGGVFIFTAGGLDAEDTHVDSTMGPEVHYSTLGIPGLLDVIREAGCICRHLEFDQYPQKHLYIVAQRLA